jgi:retinol dehydrogenase-12
MTNDKRTLLVTGANRGIGQKTAEKLATRGHRVIVTARDVPKRDATVAALRDQGLDVEGVVLELASQASIRAALPRLQALGPYDVVLHNAGVLLAPETRSLTEDGCELALQVNVLAPLWLTEAMVEALSRPSRVILVGSMLHEPGQRGAEVDLRLDDPNMDAHYHHERAYKNSKLAQFWVQRSWEAAWAGRGIHTDVVCPGFVPVTAAEHVRGPMHFLMRHVMPHMPFASSLDEAADVVVSWCERPLDEPGGRYFDGHQQKVPSDDARDPEKASTFVAWARAQWPSAPSA